MVVLHALQRLVPSRSHPGLEQVQVSGVDSLGFVAMTQTTVVRYN